MKKSAGPVRIGIVGIGGRGYNCFTRLFDAHAEAEVVALADPNHARLKSVAAAVSSSPGVYPDIDSMLAGTPVDGVVIASPDFTHEANTLAAIRQQVPALVDKPLASNTAGCLRIIEAAEASGTAVIVGFNMRHRSHTILVRDIIASGEIGNLMAIENREFYDGGRTYMSRWNRRYEWSGGLWVHKGTHDFDILNWWNAGGKPIRVACFAGLNVFRPENLPFPLDPDKPVGPTCAQCQYFDRCPDRIPKKEPIFREQVIHGPEIAAVDNYHPDLCMYLSDKDTHDNGIAIVEYDNNVRASHAECFVSNFSNRLYTVIGDRGVLDVDLKDSGHIRFRPRWGDRDQLIKVPAMGGGSHGGADPLLVDTFIKILRGEEDAPRANARDGLKSVAVGEAAELSWREHRMVEIGELVEPARL